MRSSPAASTASLSVFGPLSTAPAAETARKEQQMAMDNASGAQGLFPVYLCVSRAFRHAWHPLCILILATATLQAQQRPDIVIMKNGDRLSGEIKKLESGYLEIDMPYVVDPIKVDWLQVERLESPSSYRIELTDGRRLEGSAIAKDDATLSPGSDFRLGTADTASRFAAPDVVLIESTERSFWSQLKGAVDVGFGFTSGNSQTQNNLTANIEYPGTRFQVETNLTSSVTSTEGIDDTNRHELSTISQIYLSRRLFIGNILSFLTSSQQNLDLRTTVGGGLGRYVIRTNRTELTWLAGAAYTREMYDPDSGLTPKQNNAEILLGGGISWFSFDRADFKTTLEVYPSISDWGRVRSNLNSSLSVKFAHDLYLKFSLWDTFDSRPPVSSKKNELGVSNTVGWSF
jgi:putative salt-induced outer membrane protein YdiY